MTHQGAEAEVIYGSICSGIEAASVAWHPLGWRPAFFSEIDAFPRAVLAERWPGVPIHGDFTTINEGDYEAIELLVGGTPCQDFSVAGLRAGFAGERGGLTIEFVHLARRLCPRWLVWENVPGILSIDGGRAFGAFLRLLGQCGYGFAYRVLDAQHFGVPQRRRRVFVVGYLGDWRPAAAVLFEPESLRGDSAPSREAGKDIAAAIARSAGHHGRSSPRGDGADNLISFHGSQDPDISGDVTHPIGNQHNGFGQCVAFGIDSDCLDRSGEGADKSACARSGLGIEREMAQAIRAKRPGAVAFGGNNQAGEIAVSTAINAHGGPHGRQDFETETFVIQNATRGKDQNGLGVADGTMFTLDEASHHAVAFESRYARNGRGAPSDLVPPLKAESGQTGKGDAAPLVAFQSSQSGMRISDQHPTLDSHNGSRRHHGALQEMSVRRLMPIECERLQGLPDGYTAVGKAADGPRYRALGNSMAVPCMKWLGARIQWVEAIL